MTPEQSSTSRRRTARYGFARNAFAKRKIDASKISEWRMGKSYGLQNLVVRTRQCAAVKSRDQCGKLKVFPRPSGRRRNLADHPVGLFMMRLALVEMPDFLQQRRGLENETLLEIGFAPGQPAIRQAVIELQGQSRDPPDARKIGRQKIGPLREPRQPRGSQFPFRRQSFAPDPQRRRFSRHLSAVLLDAARTPLPATS